MIVCEHKIHWALEFDEISKALKSKLKSKIVNIHHVGSTAIPGLIAKPILDIDIEIENYNQFSEIVSDLQEIGYIYQGEKGVPDRHAFRRSSVFVPLTDMKKSWMEQHLYVCPSNSRELKRHLKFRDELRIDNELRRKYASIKDEALRRAGSERKIYVGEKEKLMIDFLPKVLGEELR